MDDRFINLGARHDFLLLTAITTDNVPAYLRYS